MKFTLLGESSCRYRLSMAAFKFCQNNSRMGLPSITSVAAVQDVVAIAASGIACGAWHVGIVPTR